MSFDDHGMDTTCGERIQLNKEIIGGVKPGIGFV
jgi:hypothetical protein